MGAVFAAGASAFAVGFAGCAHPTTVQASAQSQTATQEQSEAAAGVQADSAARVKVKRAPLHFRAQFAPPVDGGAPVFSFALDDEGEEITAGAAGQVDAGAESAADAGAESAADAGVALSIEPRGSPWSWAGPLLGLLVVGLAAVVYRFVRRVPL